VHITECRPSACVSDMSKKFNATEREVVVQGVTTFSSGGETTDWSVQVSETLQEIRSM